MVAHRRRCGGLVNDTPASDATLRQQTASDPAVSAWVSANAGSGKTRVLADRVVRLLLDGTAPQRILCLTFTKAAAAEMASRIFATLGRWVLLDDDALTGAIHAVQGRARFSPDRLKRARRLFAEALETPGGLKIQTIHAFCESLLHRFPLEADIPPGFEVLDDLARRELLAELRAEVLHGAAADGHELADALRRVVSLVQADAFDRILNEMLGKRAALAAALHRFGDAAGIAAALASLHGLDEGATTETVMAAALQALPRTEFEAAEAKLAQGTSRDCSFAERIRTLLDAHGDAASFQAFVNVFLTKTERAPYATPVTAGTLGRFPELGPWVETWSARAVAALERHRAASICAATAALLRLALAIVLRYEDEKRRRGLLDYDDLIASAVTLLEGTDAAWVLFRLDGGLDHILVDEAQDTSPAQWRVIERLSEEFYAGAGAREGVRTVFAVGDEKQSIFSFQGADPVMFEAMRQYFAMSARDADSVFETVPLTVSFRSTPVVLRAVDMVFRGPAGHGLSQREVPLHQASRLDQPGLVEIWPTVTPDEEPEREAWDAPLDWEGPRSPRRRLAEKIAETIAGWRASKETLEALDRPIEPGDILILVRRRDAFVDAMVAALKRRGIPVAGADRLTLTSHIAVMDLMALGRFCLLGDDDLALAEVLKSPLVAKADGTPIDDDDLIAFAPKRTGALWSAFERRAAACEDLQPACALIGAWRNLHARQRPFEFFSTVLGRDRARRRFVERLGSEVHDPIDAFLGAALQYERDGAASLEGFLHWLSAANDEIKRDMEHGKNEVRIMTVHGAKGLEAGVVFLPDTCAMPETRNDAGILMLKASAGPGDAIDVPVWRVSKDLETAPLAAAREHERALKGQESNRLLYVAMTRARDRLYVCGYEGKTARSQDCWYDLVRNALEAECETVPDVQGALAALRLRDAGARRKGSAEPLPDVRFEPLEPPAWARAAPPPEPAPANALAPSRLALEGAEADAGAVGAEEPVVSPLRAGDERRFVRGRLIHELLQTLPEVAAAERRDRAARFLAVPGRGLDAGQRAEIAAAVMAVLDDPEAAFLFGPDSRAEVPVSGRIPVRDAEGRDIVINGQIDRLAVTDGQVMIVDFKTNRPAPAAIDAVNPLYVRQLAAYRLALVQVFPGRTIRAALLWTDGPRFMEIPTRRLDAAFAHT
jgi:ATP-dependent helicase/nuclease subunit A